MGEAVTDVTELSLLDVLLDGVKALLLGDLENTQQSLVSTNSTPNS